MFLFTLFLKQKYGQNIFFSLPYVFHNCGSEPSNSANQKEKQFCLFVCVLVNDCHLNVSPVTILNSDSMGLNALEAVVIFFISFESTILNTS